MVFINADTFFTKKKINYISTNKNLRTQNAKIILFHNSVNRFARFLKHVNVVTSVKYFLHLVAFSLSISRAVYTLLYQLKC